MVKRESRLAEAGSARGAGLLGISGRERELPFGGGGLLAGSRPGGPSSGLDRWLARQVLQASGNPPVEIVLWDGRRVASPGLASRQEGQPPLRVHLRDRGALWGLLVNPDVGFGDAYSAGRIEVEGDLTSFLETVYVHLHEAMPRGSWKRRLRAWLNQPRSNSRSGSLRNIHHHYDLGNDFYALWLDPRMVYTCAYYPHPEATLEEAQVAKMDHVCRKLLLRPGQQVVEAGCGWGALALHMARHYGVKVRAFNISHQQIEFARERARREGLQERVEFIEDDYRNISGTFERFVSVGMLEHVGVDHYPELGRVIRRGLAGDGLALVHSIGRNAPSPNNPWIERRIFPGSYPPALSEMARIFEPWELSVLDMENLRLHYARTCQAWLERFEAARQQVEKMCDATFVRAWRLYLSGSVAAFRSGSLQLFQVLVTHPDNNRIPLTRAYMYDTAAVPEASA